MTHKVDGTWNLEAVQLPNGKWITLGIQQVPEGWHWLWWRRHDQHDDIISSKVDGGSADAVASKDDARVAAIADAQQTLGRTTGPAMIAIDFPSGVRVQARDFQSDDVTVPGYLLLTFGVDPGQAWRPADGDSDAIVVRKGGVRIGPVNVDEGIEITGGVVTLKVRDAPYLGG